MDDETYKKQYKFSHYFLLFRLKYAIHDSQNILQVLELEIWFLFYFSILSKLQDNKTLHSRSHNASLLLYNILTVFG